MPPEATETLAPAPAAPPAAAPASATPASGAAPAAAAQWYGDITDPELKGWAELKKFENPVAALKSAREAEKLIGVPPGELARIPKGDAKPEEWDKFYDAVGRPKTPEDYKLEVPMGDNGDFAKAIAPILHKAGITAPQAKMLNAAWNELMGQTLEQSQAAAQAQNQADDLNLQREWGSAHPARLEMARQAFRKFAPEMGDTENEQVEEMLKFENYIGGKGKLLKMFAAIGEKLGESGFHDGDRAPGFEGMTPAAANAAIAEKFADKAWRDAYLSGGVKSSQARELDALQRIAASGQSK